MDSSVSRLAVKQYDVFLSFRGKDTRRGIVSHLHHALAERIDATFKDDETLEIGDSIPDEIKQGIHNCKFAIVVLSANFVSSTWCLNELQMIMELHTKEQLVAVPIFYDVDPSDVKHQRGTFSLRRYKCSRIMQLFSSKKRKMAAKVQKWREALAQAGVTSGKDSRACEDEAVMVDDIVKHIARELSSMQPLQMDDIVGMDAHMEQIDPLLDMDSKTDEVRIIGIWGMGGIGKTTIAKCIYKKYSPRFARRFCFIENIRASPKNGLPGLQRELLSKILGKKQTPILDKETGCTLIKSKLKKLKVLLVLDDVDNVDQLRALAKETSWFGPGSRIIITTRDLGVLSFYGQIVVQHVNFLGNGDAIQLFKQVAFDEGRAPSDVYEQLSIRASKLAQGLPSALDTFGTYLRQMTSIEEWEEALGDLEKFPHQSIMAILETTYENLDVRDQAMFLHLACLFNGDTVHRVAALFDDGYIRIKRLEKKSLIDISPDGCVILHILVEQAGREIVRQESNSKLWRQRILWEHEQILSLLENTTGTTTTEGVALHMCEMPRMVFIKGGILSETNNLKFFKAFTHLNNIESKLQFVAGTDKLPKTLRLLHWDAYPVTTLPSDYYPDCLVELNLRYSNLVRLWDGIQDLDRLRRLDVTGSKNLTEIPDLSRATLLEELVMRGCSRLEHIPESIGRLSCLRKLDLSYCDNLMNLQIYLSEKTLLPTHELMQRRQIMLRLPGAIKELTSLANLAIEGKIHIELLHLRGKAEHLSFTAEQQIPDELPRMPQEESPKISSFYDFTSLSIKRFTYIMDGSPFGCISFSEFPCMAELNLINLNIEQIPDDIGLMRSLEKLDLSGNDFRNLPTSIKSLCKLKHAKLSNCINLEAFPELTELQTLKLSGCSKLKSLLELPQTVQDQSGYQLLELELDNCKSYQPSLNQLRHFTSLIHLDLSSHDFEAIPESISELLSLGTLCLNNCKKLKSIEELPPSLENLYAHGCDSLKNVNLSPYHSIKHLDLSHCYSLQHDQHHLITRFLNDGYNQDLSQRFLCLPETRIPSYFDDRSSETSKRISLPLKPTALGFVACIMISCERSFNLQFPAFSYDWICEEDEEIRINLRPNIYRASEIQTVESHHLVIVNVRSTINTEKLDEMLPECHLQLSEEVHRFPPPCEIRDRGIRIITDD